MDFRRVKRRGDNRKISRTWLSSDHYRIVWRGEIYGVKVPARFQACVRTIIPNYGGQEGKSFEMWDFVTKPRRYKTLKTAQEDCDRHKRLWVKACAANGIRGLIEIFGKLPSGIPLWAKKELPRKVYEILGRPQTTKYVESECESDQDDPAKTSDCSASPTEVTPAGHAPAPSPVSPAKVGGGSKKLTTRRSGSRKIADATSSAKPAEETAKAPKKRAAKRTRQPSKRIGRKTLSSRGSSTSVGKLARSSPKTKSNRSKS